MSGTLRLVPGAPPPEGAPGRTAPAARSRRRPSWADDPLDALAEEMAEVCAAAVHPDEIAAHLESEGLTGEQIQRRYGRHDTFEAAAELFARVPRAFPEPPPVPDPWRGDPGTALLRGLVFTLPGLGYALAAPFLTGPPDRLGLPAGTGALAASALAAWAWNQALAHRAYAALAAGGRAAAGRVLRTGAPAGAPIALAAALATAAPLPAPGAALLFAAGQAVYLAAATVLLVLGRERLLLFALLPLALGAAVLPLPPPEAVPAAVQAAARAALPAAAVCAAVAAAVRETVRAVREGSGALGAAADGALPARRASAPYGLFGLGCGVLTALAALGGTLWHGAGAAPAGPVVVALSLSMGAAEWLLYRCRSLALAALARSTTAAGLRWRAAGALGVCLAGYLAALAALVPATAALWPGGPPAGPARLPAVLALGAVLWTGLLLQAFGAARTPAAVTAAAAALCAAAPLWLHPGLAGPDAVLTAVCAAAALVLFATAAALLGRITTHR
ncbi:hypothetical protein IQ279_09380 [Streptomyces verrucosisporus]|uniref:hypothetical protein n=1 Tax=Streptomyces verrucosisporus TaxID=1695161 RepID=UPI0019D2A518|nr:hypothetical protein [Streptomyces verrucosisporus]MBN3929848.1 hypothetical protein [Streptomyces verrucosisporus]